MDKQELLDKLKEKFKKDKQSIEGEDKFDLGYDKGYKVALRRLKDLIN